MTIHKTDTNKIMFLQVKNFLAIMTFDNIAYLTADCRNPFQ